VAVCPPRPCVAVGTPQLPISTYLTASLKIAVDGSAAASNLHQKSNLVPSGHERGLPSDLSEHLRASCANPSQNVGRGFYCSRKPFRIVHSLCVRSPLSP
jgi:hypothetical protein